MANKITFDRMTEVLEAADLDVSSYSGRGMYGASCPSFRIEDLSELLTIGARIHAAVINDEDADDVMRAMKGAAVNNMGRGYVVYLPNIREV